MRPGYLWIGSLALFALAGAPLLAHPVYRRLSLTCRAVLAAGIGTLLVSWLMTLFSLLGIPWNVPLLILLGTISAGLLRLLLRADICVAGPMSELRPRGAAERLAMGLSTAAVMAAFLASLAGAATSSDLLLIWGPKAIAFASAGRIDAAFLASPFFDYMHIDYPPLVTNAMALATIIAGRFPWGASTLLFPLLLAGIASGLPGILSLTTPIRIAGAVSALIVSILSFLGIEFFVAGNADPVLWFLETLAMALLIGPASSQASGQLLVGLLFAGAATAKVEGLAFVLAAGALFLWLGRKELRIGSAMFFLFLPTAVCLGTWFVFGAAHHLFWGFQGYGSLLEIHWNRLGPVLAEIAAVFWSAGYALPMLLPLLALLVIPKKSFLALLPLGVAIALAGFFLFTYLHGGLDPSEWILWSAGRIFTPFAVFLALMSAAGDSQTRERPVN